MRKAVTLATAETTATSAPSFLPVQVRDIVPSAPLERPRGRTPYELVLGSGRVLRVPRDFELPEVQALVRAMEGVPC
jgi:hypothetical protein